MKMIKNDSNKKIIQVKTNKIIKKKNYYKRLKIFIMIKIINKLFKDKKIKH